MAIDPGAMTVWVALLAWMTLKMHGLSVLQFLASRREGRLRTPEDVAAFRSLGFEKAQAPDHGVGLRLDHAWRNDVENIPLFLITSFALVVSGASGPLVPVVLLGFGAARTAHSFCYVAGIQPWRTISFAFALGFQVSATIWIVMRTLGA